MKTLVIYHRADWDGIFCREICRKYFSNNADYLGWDYGDPIPDIDPDRQLVMVDISIDSLMSHPHLTWIDHHKSAIAKFSEAIHGYRVDGVAACRLAWQYYFGSARMPEKEDFVTRKVAEPYAVQLVGEYDVWDKRNPDAETFQHALRSREIDTGWWSRLLDVQQSELATQELMPFGRAIQFSENKSDASLARDITFDLQWEDLCFSAINKPRANSGSFAAIAQPKHDALLSFYWRRDRWRISLYHAPHRTELDLSQIAAKYGGGGHRGACGFEVKILPFTLTPGEE